MAFVKKRLHAALLLTVVLTLLTAGTAFGTPPRENVLFQISTLSALMSGLYDEAMGFGELERHGDLGIGTFNGLDGEMVLLEGQAFQVRADGKILPVDDSAGTPFASVTFFDEDQHSELRHVDSYEVLRDTLSGLLPNRNLFYAFRVDGTFEYVKTRSVPGQKKPYPPLSEVTKHQPTFEFRNVRGTLVGFWCPDYVEGINVPGFHLHFISEDRTMGGHLLECRIQEGVAHIDHLKRFTLALPDNRSFSEVSLGGDWAEETDKVER